MGSLTRRCPIIVPPPEPKSTVHRTLRIPAAYPLTNADEPLTTFQCQVDAGTVDDWRSTGAEINAKLGSSDKGVNVSSWFFSEMTVKEQV
jgi:hypothetical protein